MDWKRIEKLISETKESITLLLTVLLNYDNINKKNLDFFFRLYIKYHYKTLLNFQVTKLFTSMKIDINHIIMKFYKFYFKLTNSYNNIIKFKNNFLKYKSLNLIDLENKIEDDLLIFKSYFDASYGNNNFHSKLMQYFCSKEKNQYIDIEVRSRLRNSLKFIDIKFVKHFNIPIMDLNEFNSLDGIEKFKYINKYYDTTLKVLKTINLNIKKINIYKNMLNNLSKPMKIKITIINNLNSETENDDFIIFS